MTPLEQIIIELIDDMGPLTLGRYMALALQHEEFGYYRQRMPIGQAGDFITAPEISQMFGELIGLWLADVWREMGQPEAFTLLELGPGRGTLMQDALRSTAKLAGFQQAHRLTFYESNAPLRAMQQQKLAEHRPTYIDDLAHLPELPTLIVANEFFDALPARQFVKTAAGWVERMVDCQDGRLFLTLSQPDFAIDLFIPQEFKEAAEGTSYELSLSGIDLMGLLAGHIARSGGALLAVDYGYTRPGGTGTMQALDRHRHANILDRPGEIDLTAHVDFARLKQVAEIKGGHVLGPIGQGEFLQALGIELRAAQLKHGATPEQAAAIDAALRRLTDPAEMGALFKAMAMMHPSLKQAAGFP